jgi:hypothetical protein
MAAGTLGSTSTTVGVGGGGPATMGTTSGT